MHGLGKKKVCLTKMTKENKLLSWLNGGQTKGMIK